MVSARQRVLMLPVLLVSCSYPALAQVMFGTGPRECSTAVPEDRKLFDAIKAGDLATVRRLLQHGANSNAQDNCGVSAITYAAGASYPEIFTELIAAGAAVDPKHARDDENLLLRALHSLDGEESAEERDNVFKIVELLLSAGADPNARGKYGESALIVAAGAGLSEAAELLVRSGADVNSQDEDGRTAYSFAAQKGYIRLKKVLVEAGADISVGVEEYEEKYGKNAFIQAASDRRTDVVEAMLARGTDPNTTNQAGVTALMRVIEDSTLESLLAAGADVNRRDNAGLNALIWAAFFDRTTHVRRLIAAGADVNAVTNDGKTALSLAKNGSRPLLLEAGATR